MCESFFKNLSAVFEDFSSDDVLYDEDVKDCFNNFLTIFEDFSFDDGFHHECVKFFLGISREFQRISHLMM
jgi:hypothetical protein